MSYLSHTGRILLELPYDEEQEQEATVEVQYTFTPGDRGSYMDPPEPAEVDILRVTAANSDQVYYEVGKFSQLTEDQLDALSDEILDYETY